MRNHPALAPRVVANLNYVSSPPNNLAVDDVVGHGTAVSQIMAGTPFGAWPGGIAPGAQIISARIIADKEPTDDGSGQGNEVDGALGLKAIHQDLINRGARIMNNSWGGAVLDRSGSDGGDRGRIPSFHPEQRRAGGIRQRQRVAGQSFQSCGVAEPARSRRQPSGGGPGARLAGGGCIGLDPAGQLFQRLRRGDALLPRQRPVRSSSPAPTTARPVRPIGNGAAPRWPHRRSRARRRWCGRRFRSSATTTCGRRCWVPPRIWALRASTRYSAMVR